MYLLMSQRVFWPDMESHVREYIQECHECSIAKRGQRTPGRLSPPSLGRWPFDKFYIDVLTLDGTRDPRVIAVKDNTELEDVKPFIADARLRNPKKLNLKFRKALVFICSLTRWPEVCPFETDPTAEQVLDVFVNLIISRYGMPTVIGTDQGSNLFANKLAKHCSQQGFGQSGSFP